MPGPLLHEFPWHDRYRLANLDDVLTPALLVYPDAVDANIHAMLRLVGDPSRWRAHIKTAKLTFTLRLLVSRGVRHFKCATTLELLEACRAGAEDVLLAYPVHGANARRVRQIADEYPQVRISALAENEAQIRQWQASPVGIFLDLNPGMNRTGMELTNAEEILTLAHQIHASQVEFRGLHYYDGQYGNVEHTERCRQARAGYDRLLQVVMELERAGVTIPELITAGTPTFPCSLDYAGFRGGNFLHRVSPGTIVYNDSTSLAQLPAEYGFAPAALVLTRVVSHPHAGIITCDAGHKAVSADAGVPTCLVLGHPELTPLGPSEEHLPMSIAEGSPAPQIGDALYLLPRHICPTVNNFDHALLVRNAQIDAIEPVTARGRENPLLTTLRS